MVKTWWRDENDRVYYEMIERESHVAEQLFYDSIKGRICRISLEITKIQDQNQDLGSDSIEKVAQICIC
jgi:hypothetical protein